MQVGIKHPIVENTVLHMETKDMDGYGRRIRFVKLVIGEWKKLFTPDQYKILIALALNNTIVRHEMRIAGYLLTRRNLYLVLDTHGQYLVETLKHFFYEVKRIVTAYMMGQGSVLNYTDLLVTVFVSYRFYNCDLLNLLTGRPVDLPYADPGLEWLKRRLRNYRFSSALDYMGAIGPVIIKKLPLN